MNSEDLSKDLPLHNGLVAPQPQHKLDPDRGFTYLSILPQMLSYRSKENLHS